MPSKFCVKDGTDVDIHYEDCRNCDLCKAH